MATATQQPHHHQPFSQHGSLSGHGSAPGNYAAQAPAEDDDSVATEQFPEFDPSHDGSEEEESSTTSDGDYTHSQDGARARPADGAAVRNLDGAGKAQGEEQQQQQQHNRSLFDDDDDGGEDDRRLFPVDPRPEPDHPPRQVTSPVTSPPYWAHNHSGGGEGGLAHASLRSGNLSTESLVPGAITLQDNEAEDDDNGDGRPRGSEEARTSYGRDRNRACWAKSVEVTDYVVVNGSATNIGAFVVWNIRVQTLSGPYMNIRKRYSEFDDFRHQLIQTFPAFEAAVPVLPPKSVISRFRPRFLEKRRAGLQYFLNCILLNPEFSGSPVLKEFLFS